MNDYLVDQLKKGRLHKGLKQSEVSQKTGIKNTTLSNYENGVTEPDMDTFLLLCELYELDFVSIIEEAYGINVPGKNFHIKPSEIEIINKYNKLDPHGREMVDFTLTKEYERSVAEKEKASKVVSYTPTVQAAHNDFEDDPEEQEKMKSDLALLTRPE